MILISREIQVFQKKAFELKPFVLSLFLFFFSLSSFVSAQDVKEKIETDTQLENLDVRQINSKVAVLYGDDFECIFRKKTPIEWGNEEPSDEAYRPYVVISGKCLENSRNRIRIPVGSWRKIKPYYLAHYYRSKPKIENLSKIHGLDLFFLKYDGLLQMSHVDKASLTQRMLFISFKEVDEENGRGFRVFKAQLKTRSIPSLKD